jgi:gp32 DNA binding protein like
MRDRDRDEERPRNRDRERDRGAERGERGRGERKGKFNYTRRDASVLKKRATQSAGMYDSIFKQEYPVFTPKVGESYRIRIMPPTWENNEHYGHELYVHSGVGDQRYVCLNKMKGEECPPCEEEKDVKRGGSDKATKDAAYAWKSKKSVIFWIIDREDEAAGPQLWKAVWMVDRDIVALSIDEHTNETLYIDDPDEGYDVEFKCTKKGEYSEITAIKIARKPSPLADDSRQQDEWLGYIQENPIPETFQYFDAAHIAEVMAGGKTRADKDEDDEDNPRSRSDRKRPRRDEDDEDDAPRGRRSLRDDDEDDEPRKPRRDREIDEPDDDAAEPEERGRRAPADDDEPPRRKPRRDEPEDDDEPADDAPLPRRRRM